MELDKNKFAMAVSGVMGVISIICATVVFAAPELAAILFGLMVHLVNLEAAEIAPAGFIIGLAQVLVYSYVGAWIFASLHNRFLKPIRS